METEKQTSEVCTVCTVSTVYYAQIEQWKRKKILTQKRQSNK